MRHVIFDESGKIRCLLDSDHEEDIALNLQPGESALPYYGDATLLETSYILNYTVTARPVQATTTVLNNSGTNIVINNAPIGATITVKYPDESSMSGIADGTDSITTEIGNHHIKVELFPYMPFEEIINVT